MPNIAGFLFKAEALTPAVLDDVGCNGLNGTLSSEKSLLRINQFSSATLRVGESGDYALILFGAGDLPAKAVET